MFNEDFYRFRRSRTIDASPQLVWKTIATPGILVRTHPFCRRNPVERWDGANSRDRVEYDSGLVYSRRFLWWSESEGYDLDIYEGDRPISRVRWRISPVGSIRAELSISIELHRFRTLPGALRAMIHAAAARPLLGRLISAYLDSLIMGFEHFIVTGRPVTPSQFGPLRPFSSRAAP